MLLAPMVKTGAEPLGSLGSDVALACNLGRGGRAGRVLGFRGSAFRV